MIFAKRGLLRGGLSLARSTSVTLRGTGPDNARRLNSGDYRLKLAGLIDNKRAWTFDDLYAWP